MSYTLNSMLYTKIDKIRARLVGTYVVIAEYILTIIPREDNEVGINLKLGLNVVFR